MRVDVITIFPELFEPFCTTSLVGRAVAGGRLEVNLHDLRHYTDDRHRSVDDEPYGGGGGMVMAAPPWIRAVRALAGRSGWRVLLSPQGVPLEEASVRLLSKQEHLVLLCGRYEGLDERVRLAVVDQEVSIGDYVLSGGEVAAMVVIEAVSRQLPGVVGLAASVERDSFRRGLLDYPHYTRPAVVEGVAVPEVLVSGNHDEIELWRQRQALRATWAKRPDLLAQAQLTEAQRQELEALEREADEGGTKGPQD